LGRGRGPIFPGWAWPGFFPGLFFVFRTDFFLITQARHLRIIMATVVFQPGLEEIPNHAFRGALMLENVELPQGIKTIGERAFEGCKGLKEVVIPGSVKEIGHHAFAGCSSLTEVKLPDGLEKISFGTFFDCSSLKQIKLPDSIVQIGHQAFFDCYDLERVILPIGLRRIRPMAFYGTGFSSIKLPPTLRAISGGAFEACKLREIVIPPNVTYVGHEAFCNCEYLTKVIILSKEQFGWKDDPFLGCNLEQVVIPAHYDTAYFEEMELHPHKMGFAQWKIVGMPKMISDIFRTVLMVLQRYGLPTELILIILDYVDTNYLLLTK